MSKRLTAAEAREISGRIDPEEAVDRILVAIEQAAKERKTKLKAGWDYEADENLWKHGGYCGTEDYNHACKILIDLGYKVKFHCDDSSYFHNICTIIEW